MNIWKQLFRRPAEKVTPSSYHWGYFTPERLPALNATGGVLPLQLTLYCSCKEREVRYDWCFLPSPNRGLLMLTCCSCGRVQFFALDVLHSQYIPHPDDRVVEVEYKGSEASVK